MSWMDWVDLPIVDAIDYFQGTLCWFMNFARKYGFFFGLIGLIWTAIRLVNSRIELRSAWWDSVSKWFIFILLINFYWGGTNFISMLSNEIGLTAGNGKTTIINNFMVLKNDIEAKLNLEKQWANGLTDLVNKELGLELEYLGSNQDVDSYVHHVNSVSDNMKNIKFSSKEQKKKFEAIKKEYMKTKPEDDQTIWGANTLRTLNSVLIVSSADGSKKTDLTGAYVTDKPELNIWLKDSDGNKTNYFSSSAVLRIGVLAAQLIWEKASMEIIPEINEDGETEYTVKKEQKFKINRIGNYVMAGICAGCIVVSVIFALIQYVMCILEFTIVQAIGAGFIPFYLWDGTKDIPKKLIPVFIGFAIKILVMVICLIFVINMYLNFATEQISPDSGSMSWPVFAECLFICILSYVLTSNAPKIAMTILTGQPQLSMGEFVQGAAAAAGTAVAAKNLASTVTSPAREAAKKKAHDWSERSAASKEARGKVKSELKENFSYDPTLKNSKNKPISERKQMKNYLNEHNDEIKMAGKNASNEVKAQQHANYKANGGVIGSAGRMLSHYTGAALNLKQTLMQGRNYNIPGNNTDIHRIADKYSETEDKQKSQVPAVPPAENTEEAKNGVQSDKPKSPGVGERQVE